MEWNFKEIDVPEFGHYVSNHARARLFSAFSWTVLTFYYFMPHNTTEGWISFP